jgi:hypothetical protein
MNTLAEGFLAVVVLIWTRQKFCKDLLPLMVAVGTPSRSSLTIEKPFVALTYKNPPLKKVKHYYKGFRSI